MRARLESVRYVHGLDVTHALRRFVDTRLGSLDERLAEARKRLVKTFVNSQRATRTCLEGFDAAANIAREVVAEKDAEIARLKDDIDGLLDGSEGADNENAALVAQGGVPSDGSNNIAQPRKVTDAQRNAAFVAEGIIVRRNGPVS